MTKYSEALKEYNKGKDKWCIPRKGSPDYKIIEKIMEKNKGSKLSSKDLKVPNIKVSKVSNVHKIPKEPKIKVPKEDKVKVPKICPEGTVLNPKTNRCNKIKVLKVPKEPKEPKESKVHKEPIVKLSNVSKKSKNENIINFPISMKLLSDKKYSKSSVKSSQKTSRVFIKQVNSKQNVNIIANFLRNKLVKDKYTLDNRVSFYKYINNLLLI